MKICVNYILQFIKYLPDRNICPFEDPLCFFVVVLDYFTKLSIPFD